MRVCFKDKALASEYKRMKVRLGMLESLPFLSVLDRAERMYLRERLRELEGKGLILFEPWHDFIPKLHSYSRRRRYRTERTILYKQYPFKLTEEQVQESVEGLKEKYPNKGFSLKIEEFYTDRKRGVGKIKFHVIVREETGKINPPMYFDLKAGRCYIPEEFVKNYPKLSSAVVLYRLHPLGVV